ncbi:MAG: ribosome maturation factor RimP [bacterium]
MIAQIKEKIKALVEPIIEEGNAFLVDIVIGSDHGIKLIQIFLDTDSGIRISECAALGRSISKALELSGVFEHAYRLEVSSPGIDKPIRLLRQYRKNIGRTFRVRYQKGTTSQTLVGTLTAIDNEVLTVTSENSEPIRIEFSQILESKEELPW